MAIPNVERSAIERALEEFDIKVRTTPEWSSWDTNRAQVWAIDYRGRKYPPKKIISMATGIGVDDFSGGPESNEYLAKRGIDVSRLRGTGLADTLSLILERYTLARETLKFAGNHEIKELFGGAKRHLESLNAIKSRSNLHVVASYGKGNWATIPWISILDDRETETTQDGVYVVYVFRADGRGMYVKLALGVTKAERKYGSTVAEVLGKRASKLRPFCEHLASEGFDTTGKTDLGADKRLAKLYDVSTVASKYYATGALPDDLQIERDLGALLDCYERIVEAPELHESANRRQSRIALIGTARGIVDQVPKIEREIETAGAWASWWSFPIRDDATARLEVPFNLYAYTGDRMLGARLRVDDFKTSRGQGGIESPWPEATEEAQRGRKNAGEKISDVFKTWFKIGAIEIMSPAKQVDSFELVPGMSTPENVLNQNSFGYVIDEDIVDDKDIADDKDDEATLASTAGTSVSQPPALLDLDWLVARTGMRRNVLAEMVDSIMSGSPQIILAGPPGTSKSWVARQLALFITRNRSERVKFVQFHPSFNYESFVEGLRPVTRSGAVSFELTPGTVSRAVLSMKLDGTVGIDGQDFVIVMDEANRANLPRVLGELMFLFEYRDEPIDLQYSSAFSLPSNLRFIATMNTADRSIRSIDVALRRRFDVFELRPDADLLAGFLSGNADAHRIALIDGFESMNRELEEMLDRHHTIGHAFFMRKTLDAAAVMQIWNRKIFPLIEEFFFDQPDLAKQFSLERFWPIVANER